MARFKAAVYGATGYLGAELLRRLYLHPDVEVVRVAAADHLGQRVAVAQPHLEGLSDLRFEPLPENESQKEAVDVLFLALPHAESWKVVAQLRSSATRIIDCSGAFRVKTAADYQHYYGATHPLPELLGEFVYGLPEVNRERIRNTRFVASPGCFATAIELGLLPLAKQGVLSGSVQSVAITGSSGSGSSPGVGTHHPTRAGNLRTYKPLAHPHTPEIHELLRDAGACNLNVQFVPVSSPLVRGIFATSFVYLPNRIDSAELDAWVDATYKACPFVRRPQERLPEVVAVAGSNYAEVRYAIEPAPPTSNPLLAQTTSNPLLAQTTSQAARSTQGVWVACFSALDNLLKGGAGQAVQNMNLMLGLPETLSLSDPGGYP